MNITDLSGLEEELQKHLKMAQPSFDPKLLGHFMAYPMGEESTIPSLVQTVAESNVHQVLTKLRHLSWTSNSALKVKAWPLWPSIPLTSPLGKYVSLSIDSISHKVQIYAVKAANVNEVPREVFEYVLNAAYLALNTQHGDTDAYYFVKPNIYQASKDIKMLHKLGPSVNLTTHDSQSADGSVLMDVKIHLPKTIISIRYGGNIVIEKNRILRHTIKVTTRRAWQNQKNQLEKWKPMEQDQLRRKGSVDNYEVHFIREPSEYPELAADLTNVRFVLKNGNH